MKRQKSKNRVTAKSLQKINGKRTSSSLIQAVTEQQVLHIKYLKFHRKTAVLQYNVHKRFGKKCLADQ